MFDALSPRHHLQDPEPMVGAAMRAFDVHIEEMVAALGMLIAELGGTADDAEQVKFWQRQMLMLERANLQRQLGLLLMRGGESLH